MNTIRILRSFLFAFKKSAGAIVFLSVASSALLIPVTFLIKMIFDQVIRDADVRMLLLCCAWIILLLIVNSVLSVYTRKIAIRSVKEAVEQLRNRLTKKLLESSWRWLQAEDISHLHKTLVYDTEKTDNMANAIFSIIVPSAVISALLTGVLFFLDFQMSLLLMVIGPLIVGITEHLRRRSGNSTSSFQDSFGKFHRQSLFLLESNKLIKASAAEERESDKQAQTLRNLTASGIEMVMGFARMSNYQELIFSISSVLLLGFGAWRVMNGALTAGVLVSFYFCLFLLRKYATMIGTGLPAVFEGLPSYHHCSTLLEEHTSDHYQGTRRPVFTGKIEVQQVEFSFNRGTLLEHLHFELCPGQVTLMMGPNGTGKSTIVNLLLGLYHPHQGILLADGIPYSDWDIPWLRSQIGVVFQENTIFHGTIRENIAYAKPDATDSALAEAIRQASLDEFLTLLPDGMETEVGDQGIALSGGQRQKISIARCFLAQAPLIILDEPTHHLDNRALAHIIEAFRLQLPRPAMLIISHDQNLKEIADHIVHLNHVRG